MSKPTIEPIVKEIVHDFPTQYMIQQELQDIYDCLDKIKQQPTIIYIPQYLLESIDDLQDIQEDDLMPYDDI